MKRRNQGGWAIQKLKKCTLAIGMLLAGCNASAPNISIQRYLPGVWAGTPNNNNALPQLIDDKQHTLYDRDRIKTDEEGEGWLYLDDCPTIYLFQESELIKSINSRSDRESGNITSLYEGSAVWNNHCASKIVFLDTETAEIQLEGTWIGVTYLPEQQLSLVVVFDGQVKVAPVLDINTGDLGETIEIPSGHFVFSSPRQEVSSIAGLNARQAYPLAQLPRLIVGLKSWKYVWRWLPRTQDRARRDNILFPAFLINRCHVRRTDILNSWGLFDNPTNNNLKASIPKEEIVNGTEFIATTRTANTDWIFGASPHNIGWISSKALDCAFPLTQLKSISPGDIAEQSPDQQSSIGNQNQQNESDTTNSTISPTPSKDLSGPIITPLPKNISIGSNGIWTLTVTAHDAESSTNRIEIYKNGKLVKLCSDTETCSYSTRDNGSPQMIIKVRAFDKAGNITEKEEEYFRR